MTPRAPLPALLTLAVAALATAAPVRAGGDTGDQTTFDPITAEELLEHVEVLAADALMGRAAGTKGEHLAADYITLVLSEIEGIEPGGVDGTWFQEFRLPGPDQVVARNIVAVLPGADPDLAHQTIIVGAHYDHVGQGKNQPGAFDGNQIHNGADDNASGTAGVLELAEALATAPQRPRRTIAFHFYSGEELGLLGSVHYTKMPLRPLEDTLLMINMDMIGRLTHDALLVGGTGTAPGFPELCAEATEAAGVRMIEEPVGGAPSDNASFHVAGVPALFLFTGVHPDYHRAGDDSHKVNEEGMEAVVKVAHHVLRAVDGNDERTTFTLALGAAKHWGPKPWFGAVFGEIFENELGAYQVAMVFEGSPAEAAGLRVGDIVKTVDGRPVTRGEGMVRLKEAQRAETRLDLELHRFTPLTLTVVRPGSAGEPAREIEFVLEPVVR